MFNLLIHLGLCVELDIDCPLDWALLTTEKYASGWVCRSVPLLSQHWGGREDPPPQTKCHLPGLHRFVAVQGQVVCLLGHLPSLLPGQGIYSAAAAAESLLPPFARIQLCGLPMWTEDWRLFKDLPGSSVPDWGC